MAPRLERLGWSIVLERQQDLRLLGQFARCREAFPLLESDAPDVALVDQSMLTDRDCEGLSRCAARAGTRFLLIAPHPIDQPPAGARYGFASECLLKGLSTDELLMAIRRQGALRKAHAQSSGRKRSAMP